MQPTNKKSQLDLTQPHAQTYSSLGLSLDSYSTHKLFGPNTHVQADLLVWCLTSLFLSYSIREKENQRRLNKQRGLRSMESLFEEDEGREAI